MSQIRKRLTHRATVQHVARRLPQQSRRDVDEVLRWAYKCWREGFERGEAVQLPEIGTLRIEVQTMRRGGAMRQRGVGRLRRVYGRFRPAAELRTEQTGEESDEKDPLC